MILIECYSRVHIDNLAACLRLRPEKLIILGDTEQMQPAAARYEKLLQSRGIPTKILLRDVREQTVFSISRRLQHLVQETPDCVIDLTGGDEKVVLAVGAALALLPEELRPKVQVQKYLHTKGEVIDCLHPEQSLTGQYIRLSIEEQIFLYGGTVYSSAELPAACRAQDLDALWELVCSAPKEWNRRIGLLRELESHSVSDERNEISIHLPSLRSVVRDLDNKEKQARRLLAEMDRCGVIEDRSSRSRLFYTYRSDLLRQGTKKEGNALEMKTLLESRELLQDGKPFFQGSRMGVTIDWDGVPHTQRDGVHDTRNEIDVLLLHGTVPVFISCKNGNVDENELYKLHTVALRFGGPYARKILIATDLQSKGDSALRALQQRAEDMRITLVTDAADRSRQEWQALLQSAAQ